MPAELEQRLRDAFGRLPRPARDASDRARAAALSALPARERRSRAWLVVVAVAIAAVLGIGAAALAATGNLHVQLGAKTRTPSPVPSRLVLPRGADGIAIVADGKLWLATRGGLRAEGLAVSAAELSPRALYAAAGIGRSLVALAPNGRRAWSQPTAGRVTAIAWSPDGLKIAYILRRGHVRELRMIEGDGDHDRLVAARVAPAKPSWRADSLAVAYVQRGGRAAVFDIGSGTRRTFDTRRCGGAARAVAYAPGEPRLAVAGATGVALIGRWSVGPRCRLSFDPRRVIGSLAWLGSHRIIVVDNPSRTVAGEGGLTALSGLGAVKGGSGSAWAPAGVRLAAASSAGESIAVAMRRAQSVVEVAEVVAPLEGPRARRLRVLRALLRLRVPASAVSISWR